MTPIKEVGVRCTREEDVNEMEIVFGRKLPVSHSADVIFYGHVGR